MLIDIHAHAYRHKRAHGGGMCNLEELLASQERMGIDKSCVLPIVSPEIYEPQHAMDIVEMAQQYPDRIIPFCNLDPRSMANSPHAPLENILQMYKDLGCKGIGEVMPQMEMKDPKMQNLFRAAEKVGLPLTWDGSDQLEGDFGVYDDPGLPQLELSLQRFPNLIFLGHGPVFWSEFAKLETPGERCVHLKLDGHSCKNPVTKQAILAYAGQPFTEEGVMPKLMRRYPNLHGDLSDGTPLASLKRNLDYTAEFIREFEDRLYFGTDIVGPNFTEELSSTLAQWVKDGVITKTAYNKITHENAMRLLGL